jgi:hypothetical protein
MNKLNQELYEVALQFAQALEGSTDSNGRPCNNVKRTEIIAVLTYYCGGTAGHRQGRAVTREFMTTLAEAVGGTYESNPARIVFSR